MAMMMTMTLNEKMGRDAGHEAVRLSGGCKATPHLCDNLTDDDKVTRQKEAKANNAQKYMDKLKQDECAMEKIRMQKMDYYIKKTKN